MLGRSEAALHCRQGWQGEFNFFLDFKMLEATSTPLEKDVAAVARCSLALVAVPYEVGLVVTLSFPQGL